jgi:hypothetical protein
MTRRSNQNLLFVALVAALLVVGGGACTENPVGRICDLGVDVPNEQESVVASPSLDCQSRTCLKIPQSRELPEGSRYPEGNKGLCSAECDTDEDCDRVPESPCKTGFTCAIPVVVGPFCCRKMCMCKDYIVIPEGGLPVPEACQEDDPANTCCNLNGRAGSDEYPNCL